MSSRAMEGPFTLNLVAKSTSGASSDGRLVRDCLNKIALASAASASINRGKSVCARKRLGTKPKYSRKTENG